MLRRSPPLARTSLLATVFVLASASVLHAQESARVRPALLEVALSEWILFPSRYAVESSGDELRAGFGTGVAFELRVLALEGFAFDAAVMTLVRPSRDPLLERQRLWLVALGAAKRVPIGEMLELRAGVRGGRSVLVFADADVDTGGWAFTAHGSLQVRLRASLWIELNAGVMLQPFGSNGFTEITMGPTPFVTVGLLVRAPGD